MDNISKTYEKIGSLSLFKFLLAFITFLFHWNIHFSVVYSNQLVNKFVNSGAFAMSGFFILSGFLLYYIYSKKDFSDFSYLKTFYCKRLIKILPSYYFVVLIMTLFCYVVLHKSINWTILLIQIIPMQSFFPNLFGEFLNGGLWFVSVLLFLYFLFPLLCFIVKSVKSMVVFSLFVYILGVIPLFVDCYYHNLSLYFLPYFRICEFLMGMITARLFLQTKYDKHALLYAFLTILVIFFSISLLHSNNFLHHIKFRVQYLYYDVFLLALFPILIYFISVSKNKYFLACMQNKIIDYLGKIAYSFFLTQIFCLNIVKYYFIPNKYFGISSTMMLLVSFIMNMFFAIVMYELFEKKISNLLLQRILQTK